MEQMPDKNIKRPAVFLDRDGVLTVEKGYVRSAEELEIFSYAKDCVRKIHEQGYYALVVTNQSGIARGYFTEDELIRMNHKLQAETDVDAVYYCPHHEQGIIPEYTKVCDCRKPSTGMIRKACEEYAIDIRHSYMVGDRASDIKLGENVEVKTILLESGYGSSEAGDQVKPDYVLKDLREVVSSYL